MKLSEYIKEFGDKQVDVEKLNEFIIEDKVWLPKNGEKYCVVDLYGSVQKNLYDYDKIDESVMLHNKVFKTEAEAIFHRDKQKFSLFMEREFIRNSDELNWGLFTDNKYRLVYAHDDHRVYISDNTYVQQNNLYTTNKEWLEQFIKDYEDDIKKYYFEIKED